MHHPLDSRSIVTSFVIVAVLAAWGTGLGRGSFDYDEIYHAHTVWLLWKGDVPYHDFFVCHPPFAWYVFVPLWNVFPEIPESLILFRVCSAVGVAVWLIMMVENFRLHRTAISRSQIWLGLAFVLSWPSMLQFAFEFRPDAWCYALLFTAILIFRREWPRALFPRYAFFGFLSSLAVLAAPKCILLLGFFVLFALGKAPDKAFLFRSFLALAAGVSLAFLASWIFLRAHGIDPAVAYVFGIQYQAVFHANTGFGYGLVESLLARPFLLGLSGSGILAYGIFLKRSGLRPNGFELAILAFLLFQPFLVERPYKQYFAPWLLTAAGFLPYMAASFCSSEAKARIAFAGAAVVTLVSGLFSLILFAHQNGAQPMLAFYHELLELSHPRSKVAAWPPWHPVLRRDAFYGWSRSTDPSGFSTEKIVQHLGLPDYARRFEVEQYWEQLESEPPQVIVSFLPGTTSYEPKQAAVLGQFLRKHRTRYTLIEKDLPCPIWVRTH